MKKGPSLDDEGLEGVRQHTRAALADRLMAVYDSFEDGGGCGESGLTGATKKRTERGARDVCPPPGDHHESRRNKPEALRFVFSPSV
jgi:hypothetical protein